MVWRWGEMAPDLAVSLPLMMAGLQVVEWSVEVWGGNKVAHNWKTVPSRDGLKIPLQPPRAAHQTLFMFTGLRMTQLLQFQ